MAGGGTLGGLKDGAGETGAETGDGTGTTDGEGGAIEATCAMDTPAAADGTAGKTGATVNGETADNCAKHGSTRQVNDKKTKFFI